MLSNFNYLELKNYNPADSLFKVFKLAKLNPDWLPVLIDHCEELGLKFLASAFDKTSIELLEANNVFGHKVASSETTNVKLLHTFAKTKKALDYLNWNVWFFRYIKRG